jgi:serine/threonine protein kinase
MKAWAANTLEALNYIHNQGVIHVDLKLENILISSSEYEDEYPVAKLCDFGLCHLTEPRIGKSFMDVKCGTLGYIAPEQKEV